MPDLAAAGFRERLAGRTTGQQFDTRRLHQACDLLHAGSVAQIPFQCQTPEVMPVRLDGFHVQPCVLETLVTNLVHAARGSDVSLVMVDGRIVVEDGRLADARWTDLLERVRPVARELLQG